MLKMSTGFEVEQLASQIPMSAEEKCALHTLFNLRRTFLPLFHQLGNEDDPLNILSIKSVVNRWHTERAGEALISALTKVARSGTLLLLGTVVKGLELLWDVSARTDIKMSLVEFEAPQLCLQIANKLQEMDLSCKSRLANIVLECAVAVLHNISEHRLCRGEYNSKQRILFQLGVAEFAVAECNKVSAAAMLHRKFLLCSIIANLSMHPENRREKTLQEGWDQLLAFLEEVPESRMTQENFFHSWLTVMPFAGLIASQDAPVQSFGLHILLRFARSGVAEASSRVFHALALTGAVEPIRQLLHADHCQESCNTTSNSLSVSKAAYELFEVLGLAHSIPDVIARHPQDVLSSSAIDRTAMLEFADVVLEVDGKEYPAHRVVLASRAEFFAGLFRSGMRESNQRIIKLDVQGREKAFSVMLNFIYTQQLHFLSDPQTAVDVLDLCEQYGVHGSVANIEAWLYHYIDDDTVESLLQRCSAYNLSLLQLHCQQYVNRHKVRIDKKKALQQNAITSKE